MLVSLVREAATPTKAAGTALAAGPISTGAAEEPPLPPKESPALAAHPLPAP